MKNTLHTFIMGLFTLFSLYLYFLLAQPLQAQITIKQFPKLNVNNEEKNALDYLNHIREKAGLVPFKSHAQLNQASKNHANYLTHHMTYGHKEDKKYQDFTGIYASARITKVGFSTPQVIENVSANNKNYKESIDGLFSAIYHRLAFLDFRSDLIGIGISQNQAHPSQTAFVYDMSSKALEKLYKTGKVTQKNLTNALLSHKNSNNKVVIYPYNQERDVPPAFFDELPDPLPQHKVSGFPISISFNSAHFKNAKMLNFQLFDQEGREITNTLKLDQKSDPNKRLGKMDFVLFPLKRLKWDSQYYVKFSAIIDKKVVKKSWSFHTQKFNIPLQIVKKDGESYSLKESQSKIFYFPPTSKKDLLSDISYPSNFDVEFIDKNTIKITLLQSHKKKTKLTIGQHVINIYDYK